MHSTKQAFFWPYWSYFLGLVKVKWNPNMYILIRNQIMFLSKKFSEVVWGLPVAKSISVCFVIQFWNADVFLILHPLCTFKGGRCNTLLNHLFLIFKVSIMCDDNIPTSCTVEYWLFVFNWTSSQTHEHSSLWNRNTLVLNK